MKWQASADLTVSRDPNATPESSPEQAALLAELRDTVNSQGPSLEDSALFIAKRIAKHLWEGAGAAMGAAGAAGAGAGGALSKAHVALHVDALRLLYDMGAKRVPAELTALFCGAGTLGDARLNVAVGEALLRRGLLAMPDVDAHLSKLLAVTRSSAAIDWVVMALKACRAGGLGYAELYASFEVLGKVAASLQGGEMVTQLLAQVGGGAWACVRLHVYACMSDLAARSSQNRIMLTVCSPLCCLAVVIPASKEHASLSHEPMLNLHFTAPCLEISCLYLHMF